ncbi:MAG TPA: aquaporin [Kofleriaceae bacterium]|nr:aquaporin [Kofleriaceae bacterium]
MPCSALVWTSTMPERATTATSPASAAGMVSDLHADANASAPPIVARRLLAECFGTLLLVAVDCGGAVIGSLDGEITSVARSAATGLLVMTMIYAIGNVSGAHFNPAVTCAFAMRGVFPWRRVPLYWIAQLVGAFLGVGLLRWMFGDVAHLGTTLPSFGATRGFGMEIVLTMILVSVVLGTATRHRSVGANAAIASGGAVALCSLFSRPVSGASMNPARSLAPAVVSGELRDLWIYLVAPFVGAALATLTMRVLHAHKHRSEREAAEGR